MTSKHPYIWGEWRLEDMDFRILNRKFSSWLYCHLNDCIPRPKLSLFNCSYSVRRHTWVQFSALQEKGLAYILCNNDVLILSHWLSYLCRNYDSLWNWEPKILSVTKGVKVFLGGQGVILYNIIIYILKYIYYIYIISITIYNYIY